MIRFSIVFKDKFQTEVPCDARPSRFSSSAFQRAYPRSNTSLSAGSGTHFVDLAERRERLFPGSVQSGAESRAPGGAQSPVGIVQFDVGAAQGSQRLPEHGTEEQIRIPGPDHPEPQPGLPHDVHPVAERKSYPLLRGAEQVETIVPVEIQPDRFGPRITVSEHTLRPVAERQHQHAFATDRNLRAPPVHFRITHIRDRRFLDPGVQDTRTVDTKQNAVARPPRLVIHMQKRIDPRKPVRPGNVGHTVNHAGSASRSCHLPRIEHVQRKSVVRLIARTVRDRRTRFQAEIGRGGRVHRACMPMDGCA